MATRNKRTKRILYVFLIVLLLALVCQGSAASRIWPKGYSAEDAELIAKVVWGEARGSAATEQAAVIWCILNRVDNVRFPNSIREVIEREGQFLGYHPDNPVDDEILRLTYDVLARWSIERSCVADVGRVLPADYVFFLGDGETNVFYSFVEDTEPWNWALGSPYEPNYSSAKQLTNLRKMLLFQEIRNDPYGQIYLQNAYRSGRLSEQQAITFRRLNYYYDNFENRISEILKEECQRK